jgi:hypothetical protein
VVSVVAVHAGFRGIGKLPAGHACHRPRRVENDEHIRLVQLPFDHDQRVHPRVSKGQRKEGCDQENDDRTNGEVRLPKPAQRTASEPGTIHFAFHRLKTALH